jgi:N-acetyl-anhydromuramyl-L-alanine amidase AmpD
LAMSNRRDADVVLIAASLKARQQRRSVREEVSLEERRGDRPPAAYAIPLLVFGLLLSGCYYLIATSAETVAAEIAARLHPGQAASKSGVQGSPFEITNAKFLPSYRPDSIWLVEKKENYELYSNGGRINTAYEVESHPRAYYARSRGAAAQAAELRHEPVGIVFHTSESDIVPFVESNTRLIRTHTQGLIDHVQRRRAYNYVIDRFGGIYRVVADSQAANHAGHSVWGDDEHIYVGLNESFIGICFESTSELGESSNQGDQLTEAQLIAGRALTAILRSRYQIEDANCTTHALVSVNPGNMMVAYHRDWMRNFPFEAMGLSDKYRVALASITEFGFDCDLPLLRKLGEDVWPGVAPAQAEFKERAQREETSLDLLRHSLRDRYLAEIDMERQLHQSSPIAEADQASSESPRP